MKLNQDQLTKLVQLIDEIAAMPEQEWFRDALQKRFSSAPTTNGIASDDVTQIKEDTQKIKRYLSLEPELSIDYSYITNKLLKTRLEIDNLRMENVRYDLEEKDEIKRLYDFSINAFYQIENLINFYYYEKFRNPDDLFTHLENVEGSTFRRKNERNVGDIAIVHKIYCFTKIHFEEDYNSKDYTGLNIHHLRQIRNEGLHRCTRISRIENENPTLHKFLKYATFHTIHATLKTLNNKVKSLIT